MFLNLLTPLCDCRLCVGLRRRESAVAKEFLKVFPHKQQIQVYRQPGLGGLEQLEWLGQRLYQSARQEMTSRVA
jgi:hypothetical protein